MQVKSTKYNIFVLLLVIYSHLNYNISIIKTKNCFYFFVKGGVGMLIEFKVENFKSIKDVISFSMEKGAKVRKTANTQFNIIECDKKYALLKSALIFGANASGKSNFLEALETLRNLIMFTTDTVVDKLAYNPYANSIHPTSFQIIFLKNNVEYDYTVSYNSEQIHTEVLKKNDNLVFDRSLPFEENIRDNQTLLYYYQKHNQKDSSEVFKWFAEDLIFESDNNFSDKLLYSTINDANIKHKFLKILKHADFNIIDVRLLDIPPHKSFIKIVESNIEDKNIRDKVIKDSHETTLLLVHKSNEIGEFDLLLKNESLGTQAAIKFILTMLSYNSGKVLLFDEFDTSFHINLSKTLLSLINSEFQNSQFILTSHQPELMSHRLRKDQIYFTEKDEDGQTTLYSLFDFRQTDTRTDGKNYTKKYLAGRFGGLPIIDEDEILEILGKSYG